MARLDSDPASVEEAKRHELIASILEAASVLRREELRELGDAFHDKAREVAAERSPRQPVAFSSDSREVWL